MKLTLLAPRISEEQLKKLLECPRIQSPRMKLLTNGFLWLSTVLYCGHAQSQIKPATSDESAGRTRIDFPRRPIKQGDSFDFSVQNAWSQSSHSFRLVNDLVNPERYNQLVRPVLDDTLPVDVTMKFNLYQLLDVNEPKQNVVLYMWIMQLWKDEFLGWNPADYGGINWTVLSYDKVWLPDTYLYNSLEMGREATERWISAIITTEKVEGTDRYVGDIRFQYPAIYQFSCKMHILYFPFDRQNCSMMFGSWVYDAAGIRYFSLFDKVKNESFVENEEWSVVSFDIIRHENMYSCCPHPYTELHAHLVIQRKPLYYIVNLVIPTAIIALIAIVGFFTPGSSSGERSEKINLGITTLLAMSILLLMVSDQMPTTSNFVPLIGWFFLSIILLISLGTFMTAMIIMIQQRGHYGRPVPQWAKRTCFSCLPTCLFMRPPQDMVFRKDDKKNNNNTWDFEPHFGKDVTGEPLIRVAWAKENGDTVLAPSSTPPMSPVQRVTRRRDSNATEEKIHREVRDVHNKVKKIQELLDSKEQGDNILLEWEFLAAVLDRLFLVCFSLAVVIVTVIFLIVGSQNYVSV